MSYFRNLLFALIGRPVVTAPAVANFGENPAFAGRERIATARTILKNALADERFEFRTIGALVKAVTTELGDVPVVWVEERLREIEARQAGGKPHLWGAISKVGASVRGYSY